MNITLENINRLLLGPTMLFVGLTTLLISALCVLAMMSSDPSYLVVGCIFFVLGFNAAAFGVRMIKS